MSGNANAKLKLKFVSCGRSKLALLIASLDQGGSTSLFIVCVNKSILNTAYLCLYSCVFELVSPTVSQVLYTAVVEVPLQL